MGGTAKMNAMRSGLVVMGALAFGYLTLQLGFKPFLEKAQLQQHQREQETLLQAQSDSSEAQNMADEGFNTSHTTILSDELSKRVGTMTIEFHFDEYPQDCFPKSDYKL